MDTEKDISNQDTLSDGVEKRELSIDDFQRTFGVKVADAIDL